MDGLEYSEDVVYPAVEAVIKLGAGVSVDGYMLSSGEFRYGLDYISELMGRARNYYNRLLKKEDFSDTKNTSKKLKALLAKGFTGYKVKVKRPRVKKGNSVAYTISFDDFCLITELEAEERNPKALALLTSSFRELLRSRTLEAFNIPQDSLEKKQLDFQESYDDYLNCAEILEECYAEIEALKLPGDEDGYELISEMDFIVEYLEDRWKDYSHL